MPAPAATRPDPVPTLPAEHRRYRMVALAACFGSPLLNDVTFMALPPLRCPTFLDLPDLRGTSINSVLREALKRFCFPLINLSGGTAQEQRQHSHYRKKFKADDCVDIVMRKNS